LRKKKIWFRILNEAMYINSIRFLYEATGKNKFAYLKMIIIVRLQVCIYE